VVSNSLYTEDRRPSANMDPYVVTSMLAKTTLLSPSTTKVFTGGVEVSDATRGNAGFPPSPLSSSCAGTQTKNGGLALGLGGGGGGGGGGGEGDGSSSRGGDLIGGMPGMGRVVCSFA
jgi:hypothetical protein